MLAIARALIANPEIILLDEPMEGLAPLIARSVEEVVRNIRSEGNTILLVEQNAQVAMGLSDRGYVLSNGRVVGSGTIPELRADEAMMQRYLAV
jgi:branched-chain amino acid transport system ATP-binding protein